MNQAENIVVGVLTFLDDIVDHAFHEQVIATLLVIAAGEHDTGDFVAEDQIDDFAVGRIRQVQVNNRGIKQRR